LIIDSPAVSVAASAAIARWRSAAPALQSVLFYKKKNRNAEYETDQHLNEDPRGLHQKCPFDHVHSEDNRLTNKAIAKEPTPTLRGSIQDNQQLDEYRTIIKAALSSDVFGQSSLSPKSYPLV
jgi:hypothetical protein